MFDKLLPSRIKKYADTNSFLDVETMAEDLQKQYKNDYGRRKKIAFRKLVSQVYQGMLGREELDRPQVKRKKSNNALAQAQENSFDSSDDDEEDMKMYYEYEDTNMLNQSLSSLYNKNVGSSPRLPPSQTPQFYDKQVSEVGSTPKQQQQQSSGNLGWFIDRGPGNKKSKLKPNRMLNDKPSSPTIKIDDYQNAPDQSKEPKNQNVQDMSLDDGINDSTVMQSSENQILASSNLHNGNEHMDTVISKTKRKHNIKSQKESRDKTTKKNKIKKSKKDKVEKEEDDFVPGKKTFTLQSSDVTFANVAGNTGSLQELARLLLHMSHPEIYSTLGVSPPRGVLLHGPPGCGKTLLGNAIAGQLNLPLLRLVGPELVGGVSGESERRVRDVFDTAIENAPCVLFLDEIDAVAQRRDNSSKDMERRIVAQLLSCLDDLNKNSHQVMVIGATNRPDSLDPALRRAGRFDREICLGIPDEKARRQILQVLCKDLKLAENISFELIARITPGYVGADLMSLCREAAMQAVTRILMIDKSMEGTDVPGSVDILEWLRDPKPFADDKLEQLSIESHDFELAVLDVQPSAKREGFATVPDVTWEDVGALELIRDELSIAILGPVRNPATFAALGLTRASGVLLAGPPGCGKTLLAKAIANESGINFVSVKGPELLNMYVGESERAVRQCFERARNSAPCVIFFDELDSLCPRRSSVEAGASARVVNQMLTELDGLESRKQVFVMAATNRPDIIDPAVLRPGRLDKTLYIGIPSAEDRVKILQTITKNGTKPPMTADVNLEDLGKDEKCEGFTGADLSALVREAALNAIRGNVDRKWDNIMPSDHSMDADVRVTMQNFIDAFSKVFSSISKTDGRMYEEMRKKLERS